MLLILTLVARLVHDNSSEGLEKDIAYLISLFSHALMSQMTSRRVVFFRNNASLIKHQLLGHLPTLLLDKPHSLI